tara:strand:- start:1050 stop:1586 length:537 start_codon:yes stop_codon:yes gene_type:complete
LFLIFIIIAVSITNYVFGISEVEFFNYIRKLFDMNEVLDSSLTPSFDISSASLFDVGSIYQPSENTASSGTPNKEVFYVENDKYTFDQAKAVCKTFGGELASSSQLYDAYGKGKHWCSYGWSKGQYALFPAQKNKIDELNQNVETAGSCGMEGVNGNFEENPDQLYGANCYGVKPDNL